MPNQTNKQLGPSVNARGYDAYHSHYAPNALVVEAVEYGAAQVTVYDPCNITGEIQPWHDAAGVEQARKEARHLIWAGYHL